MDNSKEQKNMSVLRQMTVCFLALKINKIPVRKLKGSPQFRNFIKTRP